jgi:hypothetical protein
MEKYREKARDIDVYGSFDVIVAGGGCAGLAAAVAAARNGADTLIVERFPFFGGTATASLMANINGFRNQVKPDGLQTTKGIGQELILRLKDADGIGRSPYEAASVHTDTMNDLSYAFAIDTEKFKHVALKMVHEAGVRILFHTWVSDAIMDGGKVIGIVIENKSGRQAVYGKVVIDASGDGDVAYHAGVPFWQTKGDERKRLNDGLMYKVAGYAAGHKTSGCEYEDSMVLWGPSPGPGNGADGAELTDEEVKTRLAVYDDFEEKKKRDPALEGARIVETPCLIGIRQTRFIEGLYKLTAEDVIGGRSLEDSVAMAANPIIQYYGYRRYLEHEGYEIPYRCLLPQKVDGLIVAGRCMSSDQQAYESWRAMAHILAIGEAAGTAAALAAAEGVQPKALDVGLLRRQLIRQGAEIGQGKRS